MLLCSWSARRKRKTESPGYLRCPITHEIMVDPVVVCTTGQTYDRDSLNRWFERHHPPTDPKTNVVLVDTSVVPNWALREALNDWHEQQGTKLLDPPAEQPILRSSSLPNGSQWMLHLQTALKPLLPILVVLLAAVLGHWCALSVGSIPTYLVLMLTACLAIEVHGSMRRRNAGLFHGGAFINQG